LLLVEKEDHRRVHLHPQQHVGEAAMHMGADRLALQEACKGADLVALVHRHREMVGPEGHQPLGQTAQWLQHRMDAAQNLLAVGALRQRGLGRRRARRRRSGLGRRDRAGRRSGWGHGPLRGGGSKRCSSRRRRALHGLSCGDAHLPLHALGLAEVAQGGCGLADAGEAHTGNAGHLLAGDLGPHHLADVAANPGKVTGPWPKPEAVEAEQGQSGVARHDISPCSSRSLWLALCC
jgi:hypothetical protein